MFKYISDKERLLQSGRDAEMLTARQASAEVANSITFVTLAQNGSIDDVTASEHTDLFSPWAENIAYKKGDMRQYDGGLYRCVQAHTSQADWTPDTAASLWTKVSDPAIEYPDWSQPIGSHDAYDMGDKVSHKNKKWVSTANANVWEPGVYGWEEVSE